MRKLIFKTNVAPISSDYPYGRAKDDSGSADGTPANEALFGDMIQFFEKLMVDGGVTANGLPDNAYSGFQLNQALAAYVNTLANAIAALRVAKSGDSMSGALINSSTGEFQGGVRTQNSGAHFLYRSIDIGAWNMDTTSFVTVTISPGVTLTKVVSVKVMIISDGLTLLSDLCSSDGAAPAFTETEGSFTMGASAITLHRRTGGGYDAAGFSSTSNSRGKIFIISEA